MHQPTCQRLDTFPRYRLPQELAVAAPTTRSATELAALFLLVCAFWGLVLFVALTQVL